MFNIIHAKDHSLSEVNQTIPMLFSFAKVDGNNITRKHVYVKCRDFLGDVIFSNKHGVGLNIYQFDSGNIPLEDSLQLIVKFPTPKSKTTFLKQFENILHTVEKQNNLQLTNIKEVSEDEIVVEADPFWQQTIPTISLYSFLLKSCAHKYKDVSSWIEELANKSATESRYVNDVGISRLKKLLENISTVFSTVETVTGFDKEEGFDTYTLHNGCGFVNTFMFHNKTNTYSTRFEEIVCAA